MTPDAPSAQDPVAVISGNGQLPFELARELIASGRRVRLIGINGEVEEGIHAFEHDILEWTQIGKLVKLLSRNGISDVMFAGGVARRPTVSPAMFDWELVRALPEILAFMIGGDNAVLSGTMELFKRRGFNVRGVGELAPALLAKTGAISKKKPGRKDIERIGHGLEVARALGEFDVGQAVVVVGKRVVALEGAEGTDEMLSRVAVLRETGRLQKRPGGALIKCVKPRQDLRADLPAIGPRTVERVAAAGLRGIGVEAGKTIIVSRAETLAAADRHGIFVFGMDTEKPVAGRGG